MFADIYNYRAWPEPNPQINQYTGRKAMLLRNDRRGKYRAPQQSVGSSPAYATNNANRFRYRRRKVRNHNGFGLFLYKFS